MIRERKISHLHAKDSDLPTDILKCLDVLWAEQQQQKRYNTTTKTKLMKDKPLKYFLSVTTKSSMVTAFSYFQNP